jgi:hypothetical protein
MFYYSDALHYGLVSFINDEYRKLNMTRPETPYEAASYDLNQFRERRIADRRFTPRSTGDRRGAPRNGNEATQGAQQPGDATKTAME